MSTWTRPRWFVGYCRAECKQDCGKPVCTEMREFKSMVTPTSETHPQFLAATGPFKTKRGARFMAEYGRNNPQCQCVCDAEKLARLLG